MTRMWSIWWTGPGLWEVLETEAFSWTLCLSGALPLLCLCCLLPSSATGGSLFPLTQLKMRPFHSCFNAMTHYYVVYSYAVSQFLATQHEQVPANG